MSQAVTRTHSIKRCSENFYKDCNTDVFKRILRNFLQQPFRRTPWRNCFCCNAFFTEFEHTTGQQGITWTQGWEGRKFSVDSYMSKNSKENWKVYAIFQGIDNIFYFTTRNLWEKKDFYSSSVTVRNGCKNVSPNRKI